MPQIFNTFEIARPAYYDRQPISQIPSTNVTVGPHGGTVRASYSPPFGFAAFIESCFICIIRNTAAAPAGAAIDSIIYNPFQGGSSFVDFDILNDNTPGHFIKSTTTSFGYMAYGDTILIQTSDVSTGGTHQHVVTVKGVEFVY